MNKKQAEIISNYNYYANTKGYRTIFDAYSKPSSAKINAYYSIKAECDNVNGYGYTVLGASSHFFSCAYKFDDESGITHLIYHTHANRYDIAM